MSRRRPAVKPGLRGRAHGHCPRDERMRGGAVRRGDAKVHHARLVPVGQHGARRPGRELLWLCTRRRMVHLRRPPVEWNREAR
eukprot:CAMPEP_0113232596 /NCGR_PEP_ID=MMETSP0008_2-20120614/2033_1 /TAXON_ID=97485 /ORGANISM="Prymnesium parvum" /LENGTH=82 /DNA_ID=CAMNT_0000079319 /DNA_START=329 /DNA_END=574 /DNA_ORIENTATION=+ /assembly_acc=CAM_ASM_000153